MRLRNNLPAAGILAATMTLLGCGADVDEAGRKPVSGTVTLDAKPLSSGSIVFVPIGDGPTVGATIEEGSFSMSRDDGPIPGRYRVEILSIEPTGRTIQDPERPKGSKVQEKKNVIPDRYGSRSELTAEVEKSGSRALKFELVSRPVKRSARPRRQASTTPSSINSPRDIRRHESTTLGS